MNGLSSGVNDILSIQIEFIFSERHMFRLLPVFLASKEYLASSKKFTFHNPSTKKQYLHHHETTLPKWR